VSFASGWKFGPTKIGSDAMCPSAGTEMRNGIYTGWKLAKRPVAGVLDIPVSPEDFKLSKPSPQVASRSSCVSDISQTVFSIIALLPLVRVCMPSLSLRIVFVAFRPRRLCVFLVFSNISPLIRTLSDDCAFARCNVSTPAFQTICEYLVLLPRLHPYC
jgi:hypothetical protein